MKKLSTILICIITATIALAAPPNLQVEQIFNGRHNNEKGVTTTIAERSANYYRGMTVTNKPSLINKIIKAIGKDKPRGADYTDYQDDSMRYICLKVINNGEVITIGLQTNKTHDSGLFFIQGKMKAFK